MYRTFLYFTKLDGNHAPETKASGGANMMSKLGMDTSHFKSEFHRNLVFGDKSPNINPLLFCHRDPCEMRVKQS